MIQNNTRFNKKPKIKEEYAIILDTIVNNNSSYNDVKLVQAIGFNSYTLLELVLKKDIEVKIGQKVYIGDKKREEIQYIKKVINIDKLTSSANSELIFTIQDIIDEKENEFVNFFNNAGPISLRRHALEIIPGVGKKHLKDLLDKREEKVFENFKDISNRCSYLPDPQKSIANRILEEIKGDAELNFFVKK